MQHHERACSEAGTRVKLEDNPGADRSFGARYRVVGFVLNPFSGEIEHVIEVFDTMRDAERIFYRACRLLRPI